MNDETVPFCRQTIHRNQIRKIGIFLESTPASGGMFQQNQIVLDAVVALPSDRFTVVAAYTSPVWQEYVKLYSTLSTVFVPRGLWSMLFGHVWKMLGLSSGLWRSICPLFHPVAQALRKEQCDLWLFPSQGPRSYQMPVPALVSIHDLMHRYERRFPESASWWEFLNRERNFSNICRWAKGVLVDAEIGRLQVAESYGMPLERIHVLPIIAPRHINEVTPPDFNERCHLPAKYIFYPAQFWEHKNHKRLIRAVGSLKQELPDLALVLAGGPKNAYPSVMELIQELGLTQDVHILGYVPDPYMPELYRRARALVMPTFYGPTNIPPLEAFATGCPVAISGIYAMPEQAGDAALYFDPESVDGIADCIRRLWCDDRLCAELAARGRQRAEAWGQQQYNDRLRGIIELVLSKDHP